MTRSSRLKNILNKREDLWIDSESNISSLSDHENKEVLIETSSDDNEELSSLNCCLICSILPNLSNINTCQKHLNLLMKPRNPTQVVYMMHPAIHNCHCRSKTKHRYRSSSSSSSSSESEHQRKKRSMTVQSSDSENQEDLFLSPNIQSQENQSHLSDHIEGQLSPSLPPSALIHPNKHYNEPLFLPRNSNEFEKINSPDIIEIDSDLSCSPCIPLHRIVHVKDEDEILNNTDQKKTTINMAEATEQMLTHEYPQPIILLKRIRLEK